MAIYRCEIKTVSRSQGASAVAGAAYRAGLDVTDLRTGERHDYTRKQGVVASGILAPAGSLEWVQDPAQLWNAAEAAETRKNSVVAREFLVSLPHELTEEQRADGDQLRRGCALYAVCEFDIVTVPLPPTKRPAEKRLVQI
ncbi:MULTISPECIES: MobA/MobL family protein [unclassified Stenotrophomonas]|uniref:MobA/MobL family protein n=1 Tax=unclassified Stenotrophomonas TaxID=196198 RepID=UPI00130D3DFD|nr:hypothetical protein [Stenotrophomonas sp. M37]MRF20524.1 hypothetical protein [Stenotrophomonas sp. MY18]MRF52594.1 hypothetical protein [Stenotrophomonas sp. MY15]MRG16931.1 hypothetical protein [Stenotrophomonas sp. MY17]